MPPIGREVSPGHRIVAASMLPETITECPHCGSKDFLIVGTFNREFSIVYVDSKPDSSGLQLGDKATQVLSGLGCASCSTHTIIESEEASARELYIFDLLTQIAVLQGKAVIVPPSKWVM